MNKKVAVILCTAALLGAGIPIGIKVKNKKEKEEIEKTLKTVLIPNAEKELNNLMHESRLLRDSIAYFQIVLDSFEKRTNIRKTCKNFIKYTRCKKTKRNVKENNRYKTEC